MRRTLQIVIALALLSMFITTPAMAASNEGLEWGVEVDDEFTYRFTITDPESEDTFDEGVNITVEAVPSMPADVFLWDDIPEVDLDIFYTNGTAVGLELLVLLGILYAGGHFVVPIGNFTHLSTLLEGYTLFTENTTIINTSSEWGASYHAEMDDERMEVRTTYLKSDGVLARYTFQVTNTTSGDTAGASFIRDGLGFDFMGWISENILIVGIGIGAIVLIGAVVCVKRR